MRRVFAICLLVLLGAPLVVPLAAKVRAPVPAPAALAIDRAQRLLASGKTQAAVDLLVAFQVKKDAVSTKTAQSRGYTHYLVDFLLGNGYLLLDRPAEAEPHFRAAVERQPDFTEARFNLARTLYDLDRPAEAGRQFVSAYESSDGRDADALYYAAVSFMRAEAYARALEIFERLRREHPGELPVERQSTLARIYLALEQPAAALPLVKNLADQSAGDQRRQWRQVLVHLYVQLDQPDLAEKSARAFLYDDPLDPEWWKIHAWLLLGQQDYRRALTSLTAYSYLHPLDDEERVLLGDVNLLSDIPVQAVRYYEDQLAREKLTGLIKKTARGYLDLYEKEQALAWISQGLETAPTDEDLLRLKGYLLYEAGRLQEAAAVYARLASLYPAAGDVWLMKGYLDRRLGDIEAARQAFGRAAEHERYADRARRALAGL